MSTVTKVSAAVKVFTGSGSIKTLVLKATSDTASITLYDGLSTTGSELVTIIAIAGRSEPSGELDVNFAHGVYADISGTSPTGYVYLN